MPAKDSSGALEYASLLTLFGSARPLPWLYTGAVAVDGGFVAIASQGSSGRPATAIRLGLPGGGPATTPDAGAFAAPLSLKRRITPR